MSFYRSLGFLLRGVAGKEGGGQRPDLYELQGRPELHAAMVRGSCTERQWAMRGAMEDTLGVSFAAQPPLPTSRCNYVLIKPYFLKTLATVPQSF